MSRINTQKAVQNIFLVVGVIALVFMVYSLGFTQIVENIKKTGWWFIPVAGLWAVVYALNTFSAMLIIRDGSPESKNIKFGTLYKITLTTFAINAATPFGLGGGEPYKIMELKPYLGTAKATSSVILFSMMHIVSHFIFWILAILLTVIILPVKEGWITTLIATLAACFLLMLFFLKGYKKGMVMSTLNILKKFPFLKKRTRAFIWRKHKEITTIDTQIASLHGENKVKFYVSLGNELFGRIVSCAEIYFLLLAFGYTGSFAYAYIYSILIIAFVTLAGNLVFFSPMQVGTRELAFLSVFEILGLSSVWGITISLITRIRELFWLFTGMLLMKVTLSNPKQAGQ